MWQGAHFCGPPCIRRAEDCISVYGQSSSESATQLDLIKRAWRDQSAIYDMANWTSNSVVVFTRSRDANPEVAISSRNHARQTRSATSFVLQSNLRQSDLTLQQFRRALKTYLYGWLRLQNLVIFVFSVLYKITYLLISVTRRRLRRISDSKCVRVATEATHGRYNHWITHAFFA